MEQDNQTEILVNKILERAESGQSAKTIIEALIEEGYNPLDVAGIITSHEISVARIRDLEDDGLECIDLSTLPYYAYVGDQEL